MEEVKIYERYIEFIYNLLEGDYLIKRELVEDLRVNRIHLYNEKRYTELEKELIRINDSGADRWYANIKYKNPEDKRKKIEVTFSVLSYNYFRKWYVRDKRLGDLGI